MKQMEIAGKHIEIFPGRSPDQPIVYLNTFEGEGSQVYKILQKSESHDFTLVAVSGLDWNHDMVPWDSMPVFKNGVSFTGGADEYLTVLVEKIVPQVEEKLAGAVPWRGLTGYSLAGLFAIYSLYRTDLFARAASMSGSHWYPGWKEYVFTHKMKKKPDHLFFSLGDKEAETGNPYLHAVQEDTEAIADFCRNQGIHTAFEMNPGNHQANVTARTAKGISWMMGRQS